KIEKLAKSLGIEGISRSQVSEMTQGLNEQAEEFRNRPLTSNAQGRIVIMLHPTPYTCSLNDQAV
ncbi:MAG: hypothetical protein GX171_09920, partial [Clostridiales bacterium]|nr:hypothetical protein [Clostridiales bacterium]